MRFALTVFSIGLAVASAAVVPVTITEFAFTPTPVNVMPGDTVVWTNNGGFSHTTTSGVNGVPDGMWDSGLLGHGATFSRVFSDPGTFPYFCRPHYLSMAGSVVVAPATGFEENGPILVPSSLSLAVSPNPFRVSVNIRYRPLGSTPLGLDILDLNGRVVRSLGPGANSVQWDGAGQNGLPVQAGVYIVRLSQGENVNYARLVKPH